MSQREVPQAIHMFSGRVEDVEISNLSKLFERAPKDAVNLGLGEPDFQPPEEVKEALSRAVQEGKNKYSPVGGLPELREAIAGNLGENGVDASPDEVLITCGGTEALMISLLSLLNEGEEALVPDPGFMLLGPQVALAGGRPVYYPLAIEDDFSPRVEELEGLVTPSTKVLIVNSPSNPTGAVIGERDAAALADLAEDHRLFLLTDEVYDGLVHNGEHVSLLGRCDRTIYVNSFSKLYAMTGWRIGYVYAPRPILRQIEKAHFYFVACAPTPIQWAGLAALGLSDDYTEGVRETFRRRRDLISRELESIDGLLLSKPRGAFYAFPRYSIDIPSVKLVSVLAEDGLICAPGIGFGKRGEGHVRLSYATSRDNIRAGTKILAKTLEKLS
jgi:aspartate aminotransferase